MAKNRQPLPTQPAPLPALPTVKIVLAVCGTCRWWRTTSGETGRCVRFPPLLYDGRVTAEGPGGTWLTTRRDEECGEHVHKPEPEHRGEARP